MTRLMLGNRHATDSTDNGATRHALPRGKRATVLDIDDDATSLSAAFAAITGPGGVWATQTGTRNPGGELLPNPNAVPAWVASDNTPLATLLAAHWGGIEIRELEEST